MKKICNQDTTIALMRLQMVSIGLFSALFPFLVILFFFFFSFFSNYEAMHSIIFPTVSITVFCICASIFFVILFIVFRIWKNQKKDQFDIHTVILKASKEITGKPFSLYFRFLRIFLKKDMPSFQDCIYLENGIEKHCYFVLTRHRAQCLKEIFSANIEYYDYGVSPKGIISFEDKAVNIEVGRTLGYLKQILPIEVYDYTQYQESAFKSFGEKSFEYGEFLNRQNIVLFFLPFLLLFISSFWGVVIANICFAYCIPRIGGNLFFILSMLWIGLSVFTFFWECSFYPKYHYVKKDFMNHDFLTMTIFLKRSSIPIHGNEYLSCSRLYWLLRGSYAVIHQGIYVQKQRQFRNMQNKEEILYFILSRDMIKSLQALFNINFRFDFGGVGFIVEYQGDVPLNVTLGKHSRVLKSIAPVEGYEYTEEQLAAIENFNTLYP